MIIFFHTFASISWGGAATRLSKMPVDNSMSDLAAAIDSSVMDCLPSQSLLMQSYQWECKARAQSLSDSKITP